MSKLWIRSQDKTELKEVESLWISSVTINNPNNYNYYDEGKLYYTIIADEQTVGKFETKERALQVLDEIFNLLFKSNQVISDLLQIKEKQTRTNEDVDQKKKIVANSNTDIKAYSVDVVYQIPKE